ncbi:MAG: MBL fold metallo-hydrolase [Planctomycetota bacterium]|nr:MBL fold metallo-hydrolase [Planctomycetota bacterium]
MHLRVLGCGGGSAPGVQLSSYLIDDVLAIDAGALTTGLDYEGQCRVEAIALTHGHLDHVWALPMTLVHRLGASTPMCHLYGSAYTFETVQTHLFNERIWIDLQTARADDPDRVAWHVIEPGEQQTVLGRYEMTAIGLNHGVPCQAYRVRSDDGCLIVCGDTVTTDELWRVANETPDLGGILIECSWPPDWEQLALDSQHYNTSLLLEDLKKLEVDVPVHVMHRKPGFEQQIEEALRASGDERLRFLVDGDEIRV